MQSVPKIELMTLLWGLTNGSLTPQEQERLDQMLVASRQARATYLQVMHQMSCLSWQRTVDRQERALVEMIGAASPHVGQLPETSPPAADAAVVPQSAERLKNSPAASPLLGFLSDWSWIGVSSRTLALALGGALLGYFVVAFALIPLARRAEALRPRRADAPAGPQFGGSAAAKTASQPPAAWLAGSRGCRWEARTPEFGASLEGDSLEILQGIAELTFANSARIVIDGPAKFRVESAGRLRLDRGRLAAVVPKSGAGFTVSTPFSEIVDLGTEFGVEVRETGATDVHVLKGRVAVKRLTAPADAGDIVQIEAGQAMQFVGPAAPATRIPLDRGSFTGYVRMARAGLSEAGVHQEHVTPIWLGNLFDDRPRTRLADAMETDAFGAVPTFNTLGIAQIFYGGDAVKEVGPGVHFDLASLGWGPEGYVSIGNDTAGVGPDRPLRGIRTLGITGEIPPSKVEEGIGTPANSLICFSLDELRAAGDLGDKLLTFVCDRAGIADWNTYTGVASIHLAAVACDGRRPLAALVDGQQAKIGERAGVWSVQSDSGEPLRGGGQFVAFRLPLAQETKYLILAATGAGDGHGGDNAVWSGARLEVSENAPAE